ncbi:carboxypeptidase-like regulatory domain-containing protein [Pedobacter sp. SYP-B3415]|uniref:carboxypeptidase-like regulatory domain-containing protein n=1 Tax=Pedobacter sp. SYP-B3415 TaxID=2496641 RepID=UPI00101C7702|nr:carboxypeptidase-like regulatory domain-containing protein [Pedobacter sp. SYP-B3415]
MKQEVQHLIDSVQQYGKQHAPERLYIHTDRSEYLAADTIWFKAYLVDAASLFATAKSNIMYVELISDSSQLVSRVMIPVINGVTAGTLVLPERMIPGTYLLRAYTSWMRNWGTTHFFESRISIGTPASGDWLLHYKPKFTRKAGNEQVDLDLSFKQLDETLVGLREMRLEVSQGSKTLMRSSTETGLDGAARLSFETTASDKPARLVLSVQDRRKSGTRQTIRIPLVFNRPEQRDLQFLPEGGNLVVGLASTVAFKALNEDGSGAAVSGTIIDQHGDTVTSFRAAHLGMGSFVLTPREGAAYRARVVLPAGGYKDYPLPVAKSSGVVLSVANDLNSDSCVVRMFASGDSALRSRRFYLLGHTRGNVAFAASVNLSRGYSMIKVNRKLFPTGLARLVLLDATKRRAAERVIYIDHQDGLQLSVSATNNSYGLRDSVWLQLNVKNTEGKPVRGTFSVAVTDNGQVKSDSLASQDIPLNMNLHAELKGHIEGPGYYKDAARSPDKWRALDLLLLTQGWVGFDIDSAFHPAKPIKFPAEQEFLVKGKITNAFNKIIPGSAVSLFSKRPLVVMDTVSDLNGRFTFRGLVPVDTAVYFIQAKNRRNKSSNVGLEVDEFVAPPFPVSSHRQLPWFVNVDTTVAIKNRRQIALKREQEIATGGIRLKEVVIRGKKYVKDSKNINGPGAADVIFDEADLIKAGRMTLGDLLTKQLKNFGVRTSKSGARYHAVNSVVMHLIIDGMDVDFFLPSGISRFDYFTDLLNYFGAEDIKGIEVMYSGKYQMGYTSRYLHPMAVFYEHTFIEVTTRSGHGPMMRKSIGTLVYRPMPFSLPQSFYVPKYQAGSKADGSDIRATIHWDPAVITNADGRAEVRFFTADKPGIYTVIVQGTDLLGGFGSSRSTLTVR